MDNFTDVLSAFNCQGGLLAEHKRSIPGYLKQLEVPSFWGVQNSPSPCFEPMFLENAGPSHGHAVGGQLQLFARPTRCSYRIAPNLGPRRVLSSRAEASAPAPLEGRRMPPERSTRNSDIGRAASQHGVREQQKIKSHECHDICAFPWPCCNSGVKLMIDGFPRRHSRSRAIGQRRALRA